jgi:hypothetical protein
MERRLKQIHAEMNELRSKEASGIRLSREEQSRLEQLAEERDKLASRIVFHTYQPQSPLRGHRASKKPLQETFSLLKG